MNKSCDISTKAKKSVNESAHSQKRRSLSISLLKHTQKLKDIFTGFLPWATFCTYIDDDGTKWLTNSDSANHGL